MRRIVLAMSLSLALVMSLASLATAGGGQGHGYGHHIKACTGLSYGQLKRTVKTDGTLPTGIVLPNVEWTKPSWGAKKMWEYLQTQTPCITLVAPVAPAP